MRVAILAMIIAISRSDVGKGGLLDDALQDSVRETVFAGWVREVGCERIRDDQGRGVSCRRVQDTGVVPEDAWRSSNLCA